MRYQFSLCGLFVLLCASCVSVLAEADQADQKEIFGKDLPGEFVSELEEVKGVWYGQYRGDQPWVDEEVSFEFLEGDKIKLSDDGNHRVMDMAIGAHGLVTISHPDDPGGKMWLKIDGKVLYVGIEIQPGQVMQAVFTRSEDGGDFDATIIRDRLRAESDAIGFWVRELSQAIQAHAAESKGVLPDRLGRVFADERLKLPKESGDALWNKRIRGRQSFAEKQRIHVDKPEEADRDFSITMFSLYRGLILGDLPPKHILLHELGEGNELGIWIARVDGTVERIAFEDMWSQLHEQLDAIRESRKKDHAN